MNVNRHFTLLMMVSLSLSLIIDLSAGTTGKLAGKVAVEALEAENVNAKFLSIYEDAWKKTENYNLLQRNYFLRRMALKANVNIGVFLNKTGFFEGYDSLL